MKSASWVLGLLLLATSLRAQDPEFPREFIMHLRLHSGMITAFNSYPDLYVGGIQLIPQYTLVEHHLRAGILADGFYADKKIQGAIGPTIALKLKSFDLKSLASGGNINLNFDHLWGSQHRRLLGGGINADLLNLIVLGISIHRDYYWNNWWLQANFGFRISKVKQPPHP